jgi:hypothetical protein
MRTALLVALLGRGNAAAYASSPAPAGYHWEFVTDGGRRITDNGVPVVDLVRDS